MCFKPQPQLVARTSTGGLWAVFGESKTRTAILPFYFGNSMFKRFHLPHIVAMIMQVLVTFASLKKTVRLLYV